MSLVHMDVPPGPIFDTRSGQGLVNVGLLVLVAVVVVVLVIVVIRRRKR